MYAAANAGSYTVVATGAGGCTATSAPVVLTASPAPALPVLSSSGGTVICGTTPVTLSLGGVFAGASFQFSLNSAPIAGATGLSYATTTAGVYAVTVTNAAGCSATSPSFVLTASPVPATPTLTVSGSPATGLTLMSSAPTGNQFYLNGVAVPGATGQTLLVNSGKNNGTYTVVTTNAAGCASAVSLPLSVTVTAALAAPAAAPGLRLAPNPTASGELTLTLTGVRQAATLTIYNVVGQPVYAQELSAAAAQVPVPLHLAHLASGVYLVRVSSAAGVLVQRLVRE